MMFSVPHLRDWATRRRLTAAGLLVLSLAMLFPVSLRVATPDAPQTALGKDTSTPFPCQSRACGCRSAQQCWKKCCCFTDTQKVAWAKANRVQLPAFVVAAASREARGTPAAGQAAGDCCSTKSVPRVRVVIGIEALQCQGVGQAVSGVLISIQPPELTTVRITNLDTGEVMPLRDSSRTPRETEPPTPPPRIAVA